MSGELDSLRGELPAGEIEAVERLLTEARETTPLQAGRAQFQQAVWERVAEQRRREIAAWGRPHA